ncbi:MAG: protein phosphatase 2C domain-containing protein [Planctomycetaceae bacterium]
MLSLRAGQLSITGDFRENNEDRCLVDPQSRFFLVADGMGGQCAGEKASELATELISTKLDQLIDFAADAGEKVTQAIDEAVAHANHEIMALGEVSADCHNMGTTIVLLVSAGEKLYVGGVGDSRAYLLRDGKLEQLTKDHSMTQALVDHGTISQAEAATHRYRNVLYRYLGTKEGSNGTGAREIEPRAGDRVMLCSDGVTDGVKDDALAEILAEADDPQAAAEKLVAAAQAGGSKDNITCVVLHMTEP